jgi:hypothetical protein
VTEPKARADKVVSAIIVKSPDREEATCGAVVNDERWRDNPGKLRQSPRPTSSDSRSDKR